MTPQAEYGPDVFHPSDDDHDPDRVVRDAERNALIAKGAALAEKVDHSFTGEKWYVDAKIDGRRQGFLGDTLADALIALADAVDAHNEPTTE